MQQHSAADLPDVQGEPLLITLHESKIADHYQMQQHSAGNLPGIQGQLLLIVLHELSQVEQGGDNLRGDGGRSQGCFKGAHQGFLHRLLQLSPTGHEPGGKQLSCHAGLHLTAHFTQSVSYSACFECIT